MAARKINNEEAAFEALFEKYEKSVGLATALALLNALQGGPFLFTIGEGGRIECRDPKTGVVALQRTQRKKG